MSFTMLPVTRQSRSFRALVERGYQLVTVSELAQFRGGLAGGTVYYSFHK